MNKRVILSLGAFAFLLAFPLKPSQGFSMVSPQGWERSEFRYIIVGTEVDRRYPKITFRKVTILLDEKAFSEETLKKLFALVSKRYLKPETMRMWVYTSLDQLATPEELDKPLTSKSRKTDPNEPKHYKAFLLRQDGNESFWYYNLDGTKVTTIVLKGKHPFRGEKQSR
jgi:hypothetical protein